MINNLHRIFSILFPLAFVGMLILPFMWFGISDQQHYSKIIILLCLAILPIVFFFLHRKAARLPVSIDSAFFAILSSVIWLMILGMVSLWVVGCLDGSCDEGTGFIIGMLMLGMVVPTVLALILGLMMCVRSRYR
jgi:hypothetical protein